MSVVSFPRYPLDSKVIVTRDDWNPEEGITRLNQTGTLMSIERADYDGAGRYLVRFDNGADWVTDVALTDSLAVAPVIAGSQFKDLNLSFNQTIALLNVLSRNGVTVDITK